MRLSAIILLVLIVFSTVYAQEWTLFYAPTKTYFIEFPVSPQNIQGTSIYVSKDAVGNLFAVQEFTPPEDLTRNQSSKEILVNTIRTLVMKKNVVLSETVYSKYRDEFVSADFTGKITTEKRKVLKGKVILEGKKLYYMYGVLAEESAASLKNYGRFIHSFRLAK